MIGDFLMTLIKKIIYKYILPPVGMATIFLLGMTYRKRIERGEIEQSLFSQGIRPIYALWHGRLFYWPYAYRRREGIHCLVSPSMDGEIIANVLRLSGINVIRGSSFKGGTRAFRRLIRIVKGGNSAAIIADGSRGPALKVQEGVIHLAMLTGAPILPISYGAERAVFLKSWDRFMIPWPFSRVVVIYGDPVYVRRDLTEDQLEEKRLELEQRLNEITKRADGYFKGNT